MTTPPTRADQFIQQLHDLKIPNPHTRAATTWLRLGALLMTAALILGAGAYFTSHNTSDPLVQNDAITIGLAAITTAVVGSTLYLRYSITNFLRFWLARQSHDLATLTQPNPAQPTHHPENNHATR
jgi:hypothetical protein